MAIWSTRWRLGQYKTNYEVCYRHYTVQNIVYLRPVEYYERTSRWEGYDPTEGEVLIENAPRMVTEFRELTAA